MADRVNSRELIVEMLMAIDKGEAPSHQLIKAVLDKYDYLDTVDKAFIKRVTEGTLERRITLDYYIDSVSNTPVRKMKPFIRSLMRMSTYQIFYMDKVPDSAVCDEAVKLTIRKHFGNLSGFVNGVLRNIARSRDSIELPVAEDDLIRYMTVTYSCPEVVVQELLGQYGREETEAILDATLRRRNLYVRLREDIADEQRDAIMCEWHSRGYGFEKSEYLPYAYMLTSADSIGSLTCFRDGYYTVQDMSSMLVGEIAAYDGNDLVLDVCGAPGGKSMHAANKIRKAWRRNKEAGTIGHVVCRDVSDIKIDIIQENIERMQLDNMTAECYDATIPDEKYLGQVDVLLLDVPCSGLGVMGKKPDIKYNVTAEGLDSLSNLQKQIIDTCVSYVKPEGRIIYSTCTLRKAENEDMVRYIADKYDFSIEDVSPYVPQGLSKRVTPEGMLQLLPSDGMDGFFIARLKKNGH